MYGVESKLCVCVKYCTGSFSKYRTVQLIKLARYLDILNFRIKWGYVIVLIYKGDKECNIIVENLLINLFDIKIFKLWF